MFVLGASFDAPDENRAFAQDQRYPFRLLSDSDRRAASAYQVARDRGDKFADFPRRHSYLIDDEAMIRRAYDVTDVAHHADEVLADVERERQAR